VWHNCEKNKKIQKFKNKKNHKLTCGVGFKIVWSKLMAMTKLNHFKKKQGPNWDKEKLEN